MDIASDDILQALQIVKVAIVIAYSAINRIMMSIATKCEGVLIEIFK